MDHCGIASSGGTAIYQETDKGGINPFLESTQYKSNPLETAKISVKKSREKEKMMEKSRSDIPDDILDISNADLGFGQTGAVKQVAHIGKFPVGYNLFYLRV